MKNSKRSFLLASAAQLLVGPGAFAAAPEAFPRRNINWVVPFPPGGFGDTSSRLLAQQMAESLKTPVVVDNRPGAGGQIAAAYVKQMPADGHTLFNGDMGSFAMNAALYKKLNYNTLEDFTPVTRLFTGSLVLLVPPGSSFRGFEDLVRAAKRDQPVMYGSFGIGSPSHIAVELLQREIGGKFQHIPYKGSQAALQDLMGERTDMVLDLVANGLQLVQTGKLRALALMGSDKRLPNLPNVPTLTELGYPTVDASSWSGVAVRAGVSTNVVERLHAVIARAIQSDEIRSRYADLGIFAAPQSPSEFAKFIRSEIARWGAVIRSSGVVLD